LNDEENYAAVFFLPSISSIPSRFSSHPSSFPFLRIKAIDWFKSKPLGTMSKSKAEKPSSVPLNQSVSPTPPTPAIGSESPRKKSIKSTLANELPLSPVLDGQVSNGNGKGSKNVPPISTSLKRLSQKPGEKSPGAGAATKRISALSGNELNGSLSSMGSEQSSEKSLENERKLSPATTNNKPPVPIILKFVLPGLGIQKAMKVQSNDSIWTIKKTLMDKIGSEIAEFLNYGLFLPGSQGKQVFCFFSGCLYDVGQVYG
jgi:hypothetical protein